MSFNSFNYLVFFPSVVFAYYLIPKRAKALWLLAASYYFYMCWNAKYILLILASTVITYISGILMEIIKQSGYEAIKQTRLKKYVVTGSLILNLGILIYFKYTNFAIITLTGLLSRFNIALSIPPVDVMLPVGISFYTFQALGYTIDVYRDEISAEKSFVRYALFVSFFPQLVAGPIERSKNLLTQLREPKSFNFEKARDGFLLMLWGFFLKMVIADRIALFVNTVYGDYTKFGGSYLIIATVLFAVQIYCDFYGYSTIAIGSAGILGVRLMENFDSPYFAANVADFWRRWHISLTSWFKDYLYIPLGGSRKGPLRMHINRLIVFMISGLWHGASFSFVAWGTLNGLYQIVGELIKPVRDKLVKLLRLHRDSLGHRAASIVITFLLVDFSWIFFRANRFTEAISIIKSIFTVYNPWILTDGSLYLCGLDEKNMSLLMLAIGVLFFADLCKVKGIKIRQVIAKQDYWVRWLIISFSIAGILAFGIWGPNYNPESFIYFQF